MNTGSIVAVTSLSHPSAGSYLRVVAPSRVLKVYDYLVGKELWAAWLRIGACDAAPLRRLSPALLPTRMMMAEVPSALSAEQGSSPCTRWLGTY